MKYAIISLAALCCVTAGRAQEIGGMMLDKDIMTMGDLFELSQTQFNYGSARSMAMGGAFTSLGADVTSMATNPAGLGMYRHGGVSITPLMVFERSETDAEAYGKNRRNRFSLSSFGVVVNACEGSGALVSLNVGLGYNRIADLNYRYSSQRTGQAGSIADAFSRQLTWGDVDRDSFYGRDGYWNWNNIGYQFWPAALAYKSCLTDQVAGNPAEWQPTWIGSNADVGHYAMVDSRGSIGEYDISIGANIANKLYIGATIGIQSLTQRKNFYYNEDYVYPAAAGGPLHGYGDSGLDYQLLYAKLNQTVILEGSGVNFKLGLTYRPIANLRLAVAFHTPTYYSVERRYQAGMASMSYANADPDPDPMVTPDADGYIAISEVSPELALGGPYSWEFTSPARLLFGASYTFGNFGVISVDYERDWYNGMRMKSNSVGLDNHSFYNRAIKAAYKGSNLVRAGVEIKPAERFSLRAGFGYCGSMLKSDEPHYATPTAQRTLYYTAGAGFMLSPAVSLDVAYQYNATKMSPYYMFYAWDNAGETMSSLYRTDLNRHMAALTLAVRF